jgi:hypothetical protein
MRAKNGHEDNMNGVDLKQLKELMRKRETAEE